jgi:hypothetical protein
MQRLAGANQDVEVAKRAGDNGAECHP